MADLHYDRKAYKGGHFVPLHDYASVLTYVGAHRLYGFVIEFYDDRSKLFAVKFCERLYSTEQMALDEACDMVGALSARVGAA